MRFVDFVFKSFRALTLHDYAGIACRKTSMLAIVSRKRSMWEAKRCVLRRRRGSSASLMFLFD